MADGVYVLGGWQSDFAATAGDDGLYRLLEAAVLGALEDADVAPSEIGVAHVGNMVGELTCFQGQLGGLVATMDPAFSALPTARHEAACASGSMAVLAAMADLEAGRYDVALVVGAEVLRNVSGAEAARLTSCAMRTGHEAVGETFRFPSLFGRLADEYDRRYGLSRDPLDHLGVLAYDNARRNPRAINRDLPRSLGYFAPDDVTNPVIGGLLRRHDACRATDGSAAVVLASARAARDHAVRRGLDLAGLPRLQGWGHTTGPMEVARKLDVARDAPYVFPHVRKAIVEALQRAGIDDPRGLDTVELHDCFTFSEYVLLDHLGLTEPGKARQLVDDGFVDADGPLPVNPGGGLIGGGHPAGATGVRMVLDGARQVTGTAGGYQVDGARRAMAVNIGGSFTTVATFVVGVDG